MQAKDLLLLTLGRECKEWYNWLTELEVNC